MTDQLIQNSPCLKFEKYIMHCDNKTFTYRDSAESSIIIKVNVTSSVYGTTITFFCSDTLQSEIISMLNELGVSPRCAHNSVSVDAELQFRDARTILNVINTLRDAGKMAIDFANEIITHYPDGLGGSMNLNEAAHAFQLAVTVTSSLENVLNRRRDFPESPSQLRRRTSEMLETMHLPTADMDDAMPQEENIEEDIAAIAGALERTTNPIRMIMDDRDDEMIQRIIDQTFFGAGSRQPIQMPTQGVNAKALSELTNFDVNSVPEDFCCPLSGVIMDDPVFDPAHPQYKFERKWIERRLQDKAENPYTRTPLSKTQLRADDSLKNKISDYLKRVTSQNTFCGLKSGFLK